MSSIETGKPVHNISFRDKTLPNSEVLKKKYRILNTISFILYTFFASLTVVIPPGLVNTSVAKITLEKGKTGGIKSAAGVCVVNFYHALIAILAGKYITRHAVVEDNFFKIGAMVFAILSIYFLLAALKSKSRVRKISGMKAYPNFLKGFLVANLNIMPVPYLVFISTQLKSDTRDLYDGLHVILFAASSASGTFLILYLYVLFFHRLEKYTNYLLKRSNYFIAFIMFLLFIITIIRLLKTG